MTSKIIASIIGLPLCVVIGMTLASAFGLDDFMQGTVAVLFGVSYLNGVFG